MKCKEYKDRRSEAICLCDTCFYAKMCRYETAYGEPCEDYISYDDSILLSKALELLRMSREDLIKVVNSSAERSEH